MAQLLAKDDEVFTDTIQVPDPEEQEIEEVTTDNVSLEETVSPVANEPLLAKDDTVPTETPPVTSTSIDTTVVDEAVAPAIQQTDTILAKDDQVPTDVGVPATGLLQKFDQYDDTSTDTEQGLTPVDRLKFLTPDRVGAWLEWQDKDTVDTVYNKLQRTQVPTEAIPQSEQNFIRSQNVDDMPVPMAGPEPDWDDVLNVTTQEERQQAQQDKKKARIINMAEQAYKNNLSPEARRKYVEDKVRNGQKLSTYEEKLQEYGAKAILSDLQDVKNPDSNLRSGKETGKELNQWQAVAYMLKLDGYDEDDGVYKFHEATGGNAWVMMNQAMADGLKVGAGYMNAMENVLNVAYKNNVPQTIDKFLGQGRQVFTGDIAKDLSNFGEVSMFAGLVLPELIAPMVSSISGITIRALRTGAGMVGGQRVAKALGGAGRRVPSEQRGATVISAIDKGEFKDRHYREWLRWELGGRKGRPPPGAARVNTYFARLGKIKEAKKVARANSKIQQKLLGETRERIKNQFDVDIVDEVNGRLVINPERLREAGTLSTRKAFEPRNV